MNKTVLIADGQDVYIKGMIHILKSISPDMVIDRVYNRTDLMEKLMENHSYDLLILDIVLLGDDASVKKIKKENPNMKVMIFTASKKHRTIYHLYEGAQALVYKSAEASEIRTAMDSIFTRGYYYPQELLYDLIHNDQLKYFLSADLDILSYREREVYDYLVMGNGLLEIANTLGLHQSTISIYKGRLFKKLKLRSLVDLINYHNERKLLYK